MAKSTKPKAPSFVTPKLTFKFPKLSEPDFGNKDYPKPDGEFSVIGVGKADDPEVKAMIAKLQPYHDAAIKNAKAEFEALKPAQRKKLEKITIQPLYAETVDEDEEPTGEVEFKFSMRYSGVFKQGPKEGQKWFRVPDIFDARGNKLPYFDKNRKPVKGMPGIWGGTVGRIAFELGLNKEGEPGYFIPATGLSGLSLRLQAARIIDLVSGGQRSASDYGFDDEEDGYEFDKNSLKEEDDSEDNTSKEDNAGGVDSSTDDDNPDF